MTTATRVERLARHLVGARCARWLLMAHDRVGANRCYDAITADYELAFPRAVA